MCACASSVRHAAPLLSRQSSDQEKEVKEKMSGIMLLILVSVCLLFGGGGMARSSTILRDTLERGSVSLNEMFREVEELMEDTQHILEEAVDQVCVIFYSFTIRHTAQLVLTEKLGAWILKVGFQFNHL